MQPLPQPPPPPPPPSIDDPSAVNTAHATHATHKPSMSQVQEELTRFLQDFDSLKYLLETPEDEAIPKKPEVKRKSVYDNVPSTFPPPPTSECSFPPPPPPPSESSLPASTSSPRTSDLSPSVTTTPDTQEAVVVVNKPPVARRCGLSNGTFPRSHYRFPVESSREEPSSPSSRVRRPRSASPKGATGELLPVRVSSGVRAPTSPAHASSLPHVQCNSCGHFLCRYETPETSYPTYFTLSGPTNPTCKRHLLDDMRTKKDLAPQNTHVHFQMEDKTPPRWGGGSKVGPLKTDNHVTRKKNSHLRLVLIAIAAAIVILSLLGIVVAVTCAVILSVLQDDPNRGSSRDCHFRIYEGRLIALWRFDNIPCDVNMNRSLDDVTTTTFIRASKVYEAMLDNIFRKSLHQKTFDFTKVEKIKCLNMKNSALIHFDIYWKSGVTVPEPSTTIIGFLAAITPAEQEKYKIQTDSVSFEGVRASQ